MEFVGFPKISRFSRECIITEKIDGTNAQIYWDETCTFMLVGSRTQWITTSNDNHGFARWASDNVEELKRLGPGRHFGEWWGRGIQRHYGLTEKRFSLFNVIRWDIEMFYHFKIKQWENGDRKGPIPEFVPHPSCCYTVPVISTGIFGKIDAANILYNLEIYGSHAAPGFMKPEGIVIYHVAGNVSFKKTILKDDESKSKGDCNVS